MADVAIARNAGYFVGLLALGIVASAICAAIGIFSGLAIFRFFRWVGFDFAPFFYQFFTFVGAFLGWLIGSILVIWVSVRRIGQFVGGHAAVVFLMFFIPIIAANALLATNAIRTFPGLEVKNSYVASQEFDVRKAAQEGLGWTVRADHVGGLLVLRITDANGVPVRAAKLDAVLGRATHVAEDSRPDFQFDGMAYVAPVTLADGNWNIRMTATAEDGTEFQQRVVLHVTR